jgi:ABC-type branched-subunit amino acid transport system ATPase component
MADQKDATANKLGTEPEDGLLLSLTGVSVHFGGVRALHQVNLTFSSGETCGLIGPNGAGKTTMFDVISGVTTPSQGRVHFDGRDVTVRGAVARARAGIHRTYQRVQTYGWLSVEDNVLTASEWPGGGGGIVGDLLVLPGRRRRERERRHEAREILTLCGLDDQRDQPAGSLPIGRARMLEMARAMVGNPQILLLDEPTSGLDDAEVDRLGQLMSDIHSTRGCSTVLVEHDVPFVMEHCSRVVVLNLGEVLADGKPAAIRDNAAVQEAYLGV